MSTSNSSLKKEGGKPEKLLSMAIPFLSSKLDFTGNLQVAPGVICDFSVERGKVDILSS